jgi:PPM family protein phosphatase
MRFSVYQVSRKGGREKNEDRMGYCYTRESGLFALADGMGGHPEGEVASQLSLQVLAAKFQAEAHPKLAEPRRFLNEAILAGHHQLIRYATERALLDTPRTTIVACVMQGREVFWSHCGDSRLYMVRNKELVTRTRDHSYSELQESLNHTIALPEHINRNVLFTCLGSPGKPVIDTVGPLALQPGDKILMCSDGLWGAVEDDVIARFLCTRPIHEAVPDLVELALKIAGERSDNVTVIAVEFESAEDELDEDVATQVQGDDLFASTIHGVVDAGELADYVDPLDDDEIERSIREINEAIQRTTGQQRKA